MTAIILAAGVGSRMGATEPKVLHPLLGRPMAIWVLEAVRAALSDPAILLLSPATAALHALAPTGTLRAEQGEPRGTGDAVRCALPALPKGASEVVIACGDTPLIEPRTISALVSARRAAGAPLALAAFRAEVMVVGGSIAQSWDVVAPPLQRGVYETVSTPCEIVRARLLLHRGVEPDVGIPGER